jgi:predicted peptidase
VLLACLTESSMAAPAFEAASSDGMPYQIRWTASGSGPLVLFLHGAGERGVDGKKPLSYSAFADQAGLLGSKALDDHHATLVVPQCPESDKWVSIEKWGDPAYHTAPSPTRSLRKVLHLLDQLMRDPRVDASKVYAVGLSMGSYGIFDAAVRRPGIFSRILSISGGADPHAAAAVAKTPVLFVHGSRDKLVPPAAHAGLAEALRRLKAPMKRILYQGVGHNAWDRAFGDPDVVGWFWGPAAGG